MAEIKLDVEKLVNDTFGKHFGVTFDRLRELAEADKDGRLDVKPCKVGEHWHDGNGREIVVVGFHCDEWAGWSVLFRYTEEEKGSDDLNAVNFIYWEHNMTRASAEAALEENEQ